MLLVVEDALPAIEAKLEPTAPAEAFFELALALALEVDGCEPRLESNPAFAWRSPAGPERFADPALPS
ncbi:MAG: hypothetical protein WBQ11_11875 [Isosphaeraceae bacterium]